MARMPAHAGLFIGSKANSGTAMKLTLPRTAAVAALFLSTLATAAEPPLVRHRDVEVTTADFEAYMERVPPKLRLESRADGDRNNRVVDALFVNRMLALEARKAGLDKDPLIARRLEQAMESFLAQQFVAHLERNAPEPPNLEERARELYLANPARYTEPDRMELQHIAIRKTNCAQGGPLALAKEIRARALAGEDFVKLAEAHSDDPGFRNNRGNLGFVTARQIDSRLSGPAFALKADGDITEPVETPTAFHLLRRTAFQAGGVRKFEDIKDALVEELRSKIRSDASVAFADTLKRSPETVWNKQGIAALRTELPRAEIDRLQREKLKEQQEKKAGRPAAPAEDLGMARPQGKAN
jgi:peptidyl-prolyl cis-trans isomerase C